MKYWNKKLNCWWEPKEAMRVVGCKVFQCYLVDENGPHYIDVTEYIEVRK